MKKFISKKKKAKKHKLLFLILMLGIGVKLSYEYLDNSNITLTDKEYTKLIINNSFSYENNIFNKLITNTIDKSNPIKKLNTNYKRYLEENIVEEKQKTNPTIYLYNTHPTEEYASSNYAEFSVVPSVIMNNYILEDIFNKNGHHTVVEEESVSKILKENNWKYSNSYKASRILLEKSIIKYPTLNYFIDIHRDSLKKDKTTVRINDKDYAKVLFIVGLENKDYKKNLELSEKINNKINEYYPNLSKGIYKKGGVGVNGIYNQDFNENTILIEIGGYENTTGEVLNSTLAFAKCFMEVINEQNN